MKVDANIKLKCPELSVRHVKKLFRTASGLSLFSYAQSNAADMSVLAMWSMQCHLLGRKDSKFAMLTDKKIKKEEKKNIPHNGFFIHFSYSLKYDTLQSRKYLI